MKMYTQSFNNARQANDFVNDHGIQKENIVTLFQNSDKTYLLVYYDE